VIARTVRQKDPAEVQSAFPIVGVVDGWFFRQSEVSPGTYVVEGTDLWGRMVSQVGGDPDELLTLCAADARRINEEGRGAP
jgi:hypothetical protein